MSDHTDLRAQIAQALYKGPATNPARSGEPISDAFVAAVYRVARTTEARLAYEAADKVLPVLAAHTAAQDTRIDELEAKIAAVREELDSWQATLDEGVMAGTEWERCLATNLLTLRNAIGETP